MYLDLKQHLTKPVQKIDYSKLKPSKYGNRSFYLNNSIYFFKATDINELIGEQLAKELDLKTVSFSLFQDTNTKKILMASESFIKKDCKYSHVNEGLSIYNRDDNGLKDRCLDNDNYQKLLINIYKMYAVDAYMSQTDRTYLNYQFETQKDGYFDLAPVYDYSEARFDGSYCLGHLYNFSDYDELFDYYEGSLEIFRKIKDIELRTILEKIEASKGIKLPKKVIDTYLKKEIVIQKQLQKIIK